MSAPDLSDAYENGKYIDGAADYPPRWASRAAAFRADLGARGKCQLDIAYGSDAREVLDLFLPDTAPAGLMVFVHGGYWRAFDKSAWSHLAAGGLARGFAVAMPSYRLAPDVRISDITRQIRDAIEVAAGEIAGPIHLSGHSAGGHLVTRMLCNDLAWSGCFPARVARVVSISGLHDLRPLLLTEMNEVLHLDAVEAKAESAILHDDIRPVPVTAFVGVKERPAFIQQAGWLARAWPNATLHIEPGKHHFNVIEGLEDPSSALMTALLG